MNTLFKTALLGTSLALTPAVYAQDSNESDKKWALNYEILDLQAQGSDGDFDDSEKETSYRIELAYKFDSGTNIRGRYFIHDGSSQLVDNMKLEIYDLEFFNDFELGNLEGEWSTGIRFAHFFNNNPGSSPSEDFDGFGLTTAVDFTRPLTEKWSLYTKARGSILAGDEQVEGDGEVITFGYELGLGIQYNLGSWGNTVGTIRLGAELQNWTDLVQNDETAGLAGLGLRVNFNF